jgi:hypothetical protein
LMPLVVLGMPLTALSLLGRASIASEVVPSILLDWLTLWPLGKLTLNVAS